MNAIIDETLLHDHPHNHEIDTLVRQLANDETQIESVLKHMRGEAAPPRETNVVPKSTSTNASKTNNINNTLNTAQNLQLSLANNLRSKLKGNSDMSQIEGVLSLGARIGELDLGGLGGEGADFHQQLQKRQMQRGGAGE